MEATILLLVICYVIKRSRHAVLRDDVMTLEASEIHVYLLLELSGQFRISR